jgi:hypothetical protein
MHHCAQGVLKACERSYLGVTYWRVAKLREAFWLPSAVTCRHSGGGWALLEPITTLCSQWPGGYPAMVAVLR